MVIEKKSGTENLSITDPSSQSETRYTVAHPGGLIARSLNLTTRSLRDKMNQPNKHHQTKTHCVRLLPVLSHFFV